MCAYDVHNYDAQQYRAGQIISPLTLQIITIARMLSVGGEGWAFQVSSKRCQKSYHVDNWLVAAKRSQRSCFLILRVRGLSLNRSQKSRLLYEVRHLWVTRVS